MTSRLITTCATAVKRVMSRDQRNFFLLVVASDRQMSHALPRKTLIAEMKRIGFFVRRNSPRFGKQGRNITFSVEINEIMNFNAY